MTNIALAQTFHVQRKWKKMAEILEKEKDRPDVTWLYRFNVLLEIARAQRGLGDQVSAKRHLREVIKLIHGNLEEFPEDRRITLVYDLEAAGMLREAYEIIGSRGRSDLLDVMIERLEVALDTEKRYHASDFVLVSLGHNCLPDDIVKRWGLGAHYVEGPFSAGVFFGEGATMAIEENFSRYFDLSQYQVGNTASGFPSASLPAYGTMFNHEVGEDWIDNDLIRRAPYTKRESPSFGRSIMKGVACLYSVEVRRPIWRACKWR